MDRRTLMRLVDCGELIRRSRGVYTTPDHELTRHTSMAEVCARAPSVTVCLISALDFHELTTQITHVVWIMIDRKGRPPRFARGRSTALPAEVPPGLPDEFGAFEIARRLWRESLRRLRIDDAPDDFAEVVADTRDRVLPIISQARQFIES